MQQKQFNNIAMSALLIVTGSNMRNVIDYSSYAFNYLFHSDHHKQSQEEKLIVAAKHGDYEQVKQLLNYNIDVNAISSDGQTALSNATHHRHPQVRYLLLAHGAHEPAPWEQKQSPDKCDALAQMLYNKQMQSAQPITCNKHYKPSCTTRWCAIPRMPDAYKPSSKTSMRIFFKPKTIKQSLSAPPVSIK